MILLHDIPGLWLRRGEEPRVAKKKRTKRHARGHGRARFQAEREARQNALAHKQATPEGVAGGHTSAPLLAEPLLMRGSSGEDPGLSQPRSP